MKLSRLVILFLAFFLAPGPARGQQPGAENANAPLVRGKIQIPGLPPMDDAAPPAPAAPTAPGLSGIPGISPTTIRIGSYAPFSGPTAPWGAVARGVEAFLMMVTEEGGIEGRALKLVMFDNKYDPITTMAGVRKLGEEEDVFAFVGGVGTDPGLAARDYIVQKGIPWVGPVSGSPAFAFPPQKNIFAIAPPSQGEAATLVKYSVEVLGLQKIGVIFCDDGFGRAGFQGAEEQLKKYNLRPAAAAAVHPQDLDLKDEVAGLARAGLQTVIIWLGPTQAILVKKEAESAGFEPAWMTGSALGDPVTMDRLTSRRWAGTIFTAFCEPPDSSETLVREYHGAFEKFATPGERWGAFFLTGFGLAEPLVEGLKLCGAMPTRENFISRMETLKDFKGVLGRISYGPNQRQGQTEIFICQALPNGRTQRLTGWFTPR
ncbi:MAG: ABC transporter substrate-binding protein [Pseudomonadota bacterium]